MTGLPARIGLAYEDRLYGFLRELADAVIVTARELGIEARAVSSEEEEAQVDVLLAIGSIYPYPTLVARRHIARRVLWYTEPLPGVTGVSGGIHNWLPTGRMLDLARRAVPPVARTRAWRRWREKAANVREPLHNLVQLRRHARAFDRIVVDCHARAEGADAAGIPMEVVPFGYHRSYAGPIVAGGPRDIAVLALGNIDPIARRSRITAALEDDLARANVALARIDGRTYRAERRRVLERTRVSIDIHRLPGGFPLYNFLLASAAGAALVTEPLKRPEPLVPGVHYLEAPTSMLGRTALDLVADEPRRRRIVEAAQALLLDELDLRRALPRALG